MTDQPDETVDVTDITPPEPIPEALRLALVAMETARQQANYRADNEKDVEEVEDNE